MTRRSWAAAVLVLMVPLAATWLVRRPGGTLAGASGTVPRVVAAGSFNRNSGARTQSWDYDALGNWDSVTTNGSAQTRTANRQNEITSVSGATTPTYDANGNMTTDETGKQFVYDAWNRLKVVKNSGGTTLKGALEAAGELGLRVPEDVSIMGYDDQELARYTHPPLSTLVLPNYEMGRRAIDLLIDLAVHNKDIRPMTIKIDGPLVERASVGLRVNQTWPCSANV